MTDNNELAGGDSPDDRAEAFRELKRRVRAVFARPRRKDTGGRGSDQAADTKDPIGSLTSQNFQEKDLADSSSPAFQPDSGSNSGHNFVETEHVSVTKALTREDNWRSAGDIQARICGRSINPRILEILLPSGEKGRAIVKPEEHYKFGFKKPVWVRKDDRGKHWVVVGRYSQWGVRCE